MATQEVSSEQPCIRCGYSLRGLLTTALCPECSTPVERSLLGDRIVFSDPEYVRTLKHGALLVFTSLLILVGVHILSIVGRSAIPSLVLLSDGISLFASALFLWGWWWLTRPDAGQLTTNLGETPRRLTRIAVGLLVITKCGLLVLPQLMTIPGNLALAIRALDRVTLCLGLAAGMQYLQWLAPRLPSETIAKRADKLRLALLVTAALFLVYYGSEVVTTLSAGMATDGPAARLLRLVRSVSKAASGWVALYCFIILGSLFNQLRKELNRISKAQQGPPPAVSGGSETTQEAAT